MVAVEKGVTRTYAGADYPPISPHSKQQLWDCAVACVGTAKAEVVNITTVSTSTSYTTLPIHPQPHALHSTPHGEIVTNSKHHDSTADLGKGLVLP